MKTFALQEAKPTNKCQTLLFRFFVDLFYNYRVVQKTDTQFYFWDNFGNSAPILTILSLLQAEIYGA